MSATKRTDRSGDHRYAASPSASVSTAAIASPCSSGTWTSSSSCRQSTTRPPSDLPRPTEINISRFFTTIQFFAAAGLNFPEIFCELGLQGRSIWEGPKINPLPPGLVWLRGMDQPPQLRRREELEALLASKTLRRDA